MLPEMYGNMGSAVPVMMEAAVPVMISMRSNLVANLKS